MSSQGEHEFTPRPYQIALYEKAVAENSIVYLPTGSGKTYIAVLVIIKLSGDLHKPYAEGGKRTIFIVNTVALVQQQCLFLARHTGLIVKGFSGDQQVENWTRTEWLKEITSSQVMVMTAQIFLNLLEHAIMPLSKVNLLIFDECHHAVKDHPMRQIMQRFDNWAINEHPRVLGLSASLLNANITASNLESTLKELEITFQSKIITVETLESVSLFSTKPKEIIEYYKPLLQHDISNVITKIINCSDSLYTMMDNSYDHVQKRSSHRFRPESKFQKLNRILSDVKEHLLEMGLYGGLKGVLLHMIQIDSMRRSSHNAKFLGIVNHLNTQLIKIQKFICNQITGVMSQKFLDKYTSPKVSKLVNVLQNFYQSHNREQNFCCIIFVQRRFSAKVLYHILKELSLHDESFKFLKPDYIVGQSNDPYKNAREQLCLSKWNKEVLSKFKTGKINCIIATDVVDEGVDIPSCTLVVRYYAPMDFRSYIQSKGRARHSSSHFVLLVAYGDNQFLSRYDEYQRTEQALQEALHGRSTRQAPVTDEIDQSLYKFDIEPYVVQHKCGKKSIITEQNAISLINCYCSSLFVSKYCSIAPIWIQEDIETLYGTEYKVHLTLPIMSPLKSTIVSDQYESISAAKRSAAFKACVELYKMGEINENLAPSKLYRVIDHSEVLFPHLQSENKSSATSRKSYQLEYPEALIAAYPKENEILYLHVFEVLPNEQKTVDDTWNSLFYNFLVSEHTYGILSTKEMPEIPSFPLFTKAGDFIVNIKTNNLVPSLTNCEINTLKQFHYLIFNEILTLAKKFMIFDVNNQENSFLVVPVNSNQQINWDIITGSINVPIIQPSQYLDAKKLDYVHSLVMPIYRASSVYLVTGICDEMKPSSSFITEAYTSYVEYFTKRHKLKIENVDQPMLKVKPIPTETNWLTPRNRKTTESYYELLVPEFCRKINFPTVYWLKAAALPSILHRTSQLLVAEDFRVKIAREACLNLSRNVGDRWDPLKIIEDANSGKRLDSNAHTASNSTSSPSHESAIALNGLSQNRNHSTWDEYEEPLDLERNLGYLNAEDIDYYYKFMKHVTHKDVMNLKYQNSIKCDYSFSAREQEPILQMLKKSSDSGPSPVDVLQSLTAKKSRDFINYERLETLGDSFLKYVISLYLFHTFPNYGEQLLSGLKCKIVSNSNLFGCGKLKNLAGRMNIKQFSPTNDFVIPAFSVDLALKKQIIDDKMPASILHKIKIPEEERLSGVISEDTFKSLKEQLTMTSNEVIEETGGEWFLGRQMVSEKTISDCVEAIIGLYLTHTGIEGAFSVLKWFGILPTTTNIKECLYSAAEDPQKESGDIDRYMPWASVIEKRIGYTFRNRAFLLQAFTHPTYIGNTKITDSYERTEFLGDALLDFLLTVHIFETCGNLSPSEITDLRSALVNNIIFSCLSVRYGLHTALLAYAPSLFNAIDKFVKFQEDRQYKVDDELLLVLMEEDDCGISEFVDVPKVLGDLFEAVIGAIYLDSQKDLQVTWKVIYNLMKTEIETFSKNVPKQPSRVIHETTGLNPKFSAPQAVEDSNIVMITLSINDEGTNKFFHGFGADKKQAKCAASKQALRWLRSKK